MEFKVQDKNSQVLGSVVDNWSGANFPSKATIVGQYCKLEVLSINDHAEALFNAFSQDAEHRNWVYLPYGPFEKIADFKQWLQFITSGSDPMLYAIVDQQSNEAIGLAGYLSINPIHGVIEVGHVHFSPKLQNTPVATEAIFLLMQSVFDELGYRRCEWKCNALNEKSKSAALRFGFSFEGVFRQALVVKKRNRDTAWYSLLDSEWSNAKKRFELWLKPENFDTKGKQKTKLQSI